MTVGKIHGTPRGEWQPPSTSASNEPRPPQEPASARQLDCVVSHADRQPSAIDPVTRQSALAALRTLEPASRTRGRGAWARQMASSIRPRRFNRQVARSLTPAVVAELTVNERAQLVHRLLRGYAGNAAQDAILRIFQASRPAELSLIIMELNARGTAEYLVYKFHGRQAVSLNDLIRARLEQLTPEAAEVVLRLAAHHGFLGMTHKEPGVYLVRQMRSQDPQIRAWAERIFDIMSPNPW